MPESSRGPLVGRTISHYRVVAQLGAGGMGVVYRGEDVRLGRPVAIKVVVYFCAIDTLGGAGVGAEARAASALNHPNISTIYDIGTDEGRPFIVMELMEGQTLRERLGRGHLRLHELVDVGIQIADALQAAHAAGIMHRDIKPANIFLTGRGHVKLLDFGLAKLSAAQPNPDSVTLGTAHLTMAGTTFGTVAYMSPEQAAGDELDGRTDLFSLGVVLYECATGQRPFEGKTHAVILSEILHRPPTPPSALNQELPTRLQEIILACLEKDRELRYQSAADLRADLKRVRRDLESGRIHTGATTEISGDRQAPTTPLAVTGHTQAAARMQTATRMQATGGARPSEAAVPARSWVPLAVGAVLVIAAAGAGTMYIMSSRQAGATTKMTIGSDNATPRSTAADPTTSAEPVTPTGSTAGPQPEMAGADQSVRDRLARARSSLAAGNYRAAQAYASEVLAASPGNAAALEVQQRSADALNRFDRAIALTRGRLAAGDVPGAARALAEARDIDPASPVAIELGGDVARRSRAATMHAAEPTQAAAPPTPAATASIQAVSEPTPTPAPVPPASVPPASAPSIAAPPASAPAFPPSGATSVDAPAAPPTVAPESPPSAASAAADRTGAARAAASPAIDEGAAVRGVVAAYARAIESKDLALFRSVKPNLSREEERRLQDGFRAVTSQRVQITPTAVTIRDQEASVVVRRQDVIDAGGRRQTVDSRQTFSLARTASGWVITDIR